MTVSSVNIQFDELVNCNDKKQLRHSLCTGMTGVLTFYDTIKISTGLKIMAATKEGFNQWAIN